MNSRVIGFPSNPAVDQEYQGWVWDGEKWVSTAVDGGAGAGMVISETEPTDKVEGMQWLNPTTGLVLFWDDEKWLQMPGSQDGADGVDGVWEEDANGASYTGNVTVTGDLLASKSDAGANAFAAGINAGQITQGINTVAVGFESGQTTQGVNGVAVGCLAGRAEQGDDAVAVGRSAGQITQGKSATAVGYTAGQTNQGEYSTAIGYEAGLDDQGSFSTAVGCSAGKINQSQYAVAVGVNAGLSDQGYVGTAVGYSAGQTSQGNYGVALGYAAGQSGQGGYSIAIGTNAGQTNQGSYGIIINSSAVERTSTHSGHIHIKSSKASLDFDPQIGSGQWTFSGGPVNGINGFRQNGVPVIDAKGLISALATLRNATKDETTLEGMRDALADAIGGLIENLEHEIATMPAPEPEASTQEIAE